MSLKLNVGGFLSFAMVLWVPESRADVQQAARPGTLSYVEGQKTRPTRDIQCQEIHPRTRFEHRHAFVNVGGQNRAWVGSLLPRPIRPRASPKIVLDPVP